MNTEEAAVPQDEIKTAPTPEGFLRAATLAVDAWNRTLNSEHRDPRMIGVIAALDGEGTRGDFERGSEAYRVANLRASVASYQREERAIEALLAKSARVIPNVNTPVTTLQDRVAWNLKIARLETKALRQAAKGERGSGEFDDNTVAQQIAVMRETLTEVERAIVSKGTCDVRDAGPAQTVAALARNLEGCKTKITHLRAESTANEQAMGTDYEPEDFIDGSVAERISGMVHDLTSCREELAQSKSEEQQCIEEILEKIPPACTWLPDPGAYPEGSLEGSVAEKIREVWGNGNALLTMKEENEEALICSLHQGRLVTTKGSQANRILKLRDRLNQREEGSHQALHHEIGRLQKELRSANETAIHYREDLQKAREEGVRMTNNLQAQLAVSQGLRADDNNVRQALNSAACDPTKFTPGTQAHRVSLLRQRAQLLQSRLELRDTASDELLDAQEHIKELEQRLALNVELSEVRDREKDGKLLRTYPAMKHAVETAGRLWSDKDRQSQVESLATIATGMALHLPEGIVKETIWAMANTIFELAKGHREGTSCRTN